MISIPSIPSSLPEGAPATGFRFATLLLALAVNLTAQEYLPPSDFFPTTPGSVWTYKKTIGSLTGDSLVESVMSVAFDARYHLVSLHNGSSTCPQENFFVPLFNEGFTSCADRSDNFIFGSRRRFDGVAGCGLLVDILRTEPRSTWSIPEGTGGRCGSFYPCGSRTVISLDTSVMVSGVLLDSLLHVRQSNSGGTEIQDDYYRSKTGLVYQIIRNTASRTQLELQLKEFIPGADARLDQVVVPEKISGLNTDGMPISHWGNIWSFFVPCFPPNTPGNKANPMFVYKLYASADTMLVESHASSNLPVVLTSDGGTTRKLDDNKLILEENRWHGVNLELNQAGNPRYRAAPALRGTVCIVPYVPVAFDSMHNSLEVSGFPDSSIVWLMERSDGFSTDSVGKGLSFTPVKPGNYRASIREGTFADSLCGKSFTLESNKISVTHIISNRTAKSGLPAVPVRIFGRTVAFRMSAEEFMAARIRILDVLGRAQGGIRAGLRDGLPQITAPDRMVPGLYFYEVQSGSRRERGSVLLGNAP